jgi:hypothetical protein
MLITKTGEEQDAASWTLNGNVERKKETTVAKS